MPKEVAAIFIQKLREMAEKFLGKKIMDAVLAVPSTFNDSQRKAMKDVRESNMVKFTQLRVKPLPSPLSHTTELNTSW